jgi:hypothetical protein
VIDNQRHAGSCGPVAIKNTLELLGIKISYDNIINICSLRGYSHSHGMASIKLRKVLRKFGVIFSYKTRIVMKDISKALKENKIVILSFAHKAGAHYVVIDRETKCFFRAWNWSCTKGNMMSKKKMAQYIRYSYRYWSMWYPTMILIDRDSYKR